MVIKYNVQDRRKFADTISGIIGERSVYLRTPSFAYKIGEWYTVTKEGNLDIFDRADSEEVENLIEQLDKLGFIAEPSDKNETVLSGSEVFSDELIGFSIVIPLNKLSDKPFSENTLDKFNDIVAGKKALFQKALGTTTELLVERKEDSLQFNWFDRVIDNKHLNMYITLIKALYKFAENAKRVNVSHKEIENEKFTMRTFLNRIGLSGKEHKELRKELLKSLSGNCAFRYSEPKSARKMKFPNKETIEQLRCKYPVGTRIELIAMDDPQAPPSGTHGTVVGIDDIGSILVHWDTGSSLNVIYGVDSVKKI